MADKIPVTVLSGGLGAGKTTAVNHILHNSAGRSIAVLVNDMGEINVDAELLATGTDIAATGGIAELSNGCICCELQDDLETEVARLASERDFEYLLVESSGISEPEPVARLFTTSSRAAAAYDLDTMVTVVDASQFVGTFGDMGHVERETAPDSEDRPLSDLLIEQVEFADVILLNKCDLVADADLDHAEELLAALAPRAEIVRTVHAQVDPDDILDTGLFDPTETGSGAAWQQAISEAGHARSGEAVHDHASSHHDHAHPDEVYSVSSFTYRRRRPFHPERIAGLFADLPPSVVRSKGVFWVAGRDETALLLSQAGPNVRIEVLGPWLASLPEVERDLYRGSRPEADWDEEHGDRRTELVFIGRGIDEATLVARLDDCLTTGEWERDRGDEIFPDADEEALELEKQ